MNTFVSVITFATAASAQIMVNGFSMVNISSVDAPVPDASSVPVAPSSVAYYAAASPSAAASSLNDSAAYLPPGYTMASVSSSSPPSYYTPPPPAYSQMPYSSFVSGGYKSMECGYGYQKMSDGSCQPQSWVCPFDHLSAACNVLTSC